MNVKLFFSTVILKKIKLQLLLKAAGDLNLAELSIININYYVFKSY